MHFKSEFHGLNKKIKIAQKNGFRFIEIVNLTIKFFSSQSNTNISHWIKLPIPKKHRHFSRIMSQKPEYVKTSCIDIDNSFQFAFRK